jgi:hypothetical protein
MTPNPTLDAGVALVASRQLGLLTGTQARRIGFTHHEVQHRLRTGRWKQVTRDLFVVAGTPPSWQRDALAACLAGPPGAAASHVTGAALWQCAAPSPLPHVTFPPTASARLRIAKVHRSALGPEDVTRIGVIPVTRVARTLVDLAAVAAAPALERAVDTALDRGLTRVDDVMAAIGRAQRRPGRGGVTALVRALEAWTDPIKPDSPAEARLIRRLAQWRITGAVRQHVIRDAAGAHVARVDLAWPARRVGLEYDGAAYHGPRRFEHDEQRHAAVEALGWTLEHVDRLDLRPGQTRLRDVLLPLLGRPAA